MAKKKTKKKKKWIQGVVKDPGSFTAQAKAVGMEVQAFAAKVLANKSKYSSTTVKRAVLAQNFAKMSKKK